MALSNFGDMGHGKYVGLVTWAAKSGSAIEVTAAVNGKAETFSTNKKVDVDDIFEEDGATMANSMSAVQTAIGGGRYAVMSFDKDGNVSKVNFFGTDMKSSDDKYEVKRLVVGNKVSTKYLSYLAETVTFADEDTFNKVTNINWKDDVEYDDDAVFYVMDSKPTTANEVYSGVVLAAKNGFAEDSVYKKSKDSLKISVGSVEDVEASYIKGTDADTFRVVDVIIKDADKAVATYIFDKDMESTNTVAAAPSTLAVNDFTVTNNNATNGSASVPAVAQIDTITVANPATASAVATITINGKVVSVPVAAGDTANAIAAAIVREMNNDADVAANFDVAVATDANVVATKASKVLVTAKTAGVSFAMSVNGNGCGAGITSATTRNSAVAQPEVEAKAAITTIVLDDDLYKIGSNNQIKVSKGGENACVTYTANEIVASETIVADVAAQIQATFSHIADVKVDGNKITLTADSTVAVGSNLGITPAVQSAS